MLATRGGDMNEPQNNDAPARPNGNGNAPAEERDDQQNAAGAGAEAQDLRGAEAQRRREQALSRDTLSRTLRDFPLEDKFRIAQELRSQVRTAVLDKIPQFLFDTEDRSSAPPRKGMVGDFTAWKWRDWLEDVQNCMPLEHVLVDLEKKCAYDWENHDHGKRFRDHSQLVNLWYALAARLDPWPQQPDRRFAWTTYFKQLVHPDDEDITDDADFGTENNVRYYRYLADFMPPSSRAGSSMSFRNRSNYFDSRDFGPMGSALTMSYVRADRVVQQRLARIGISLHLGRGGKKTTAQLDLPPEEQENAASDSDMSLAGLVPTRETLRSHRRHEPEREDARITYWTLVDQMCLFPTKSDAVKRSLHDMASHLEPLARKRKTTVIHRDGHVGALLRMTEHPRFDYSLWTTRAAGLLQYIELFELDINFQHRQRDGDGTETQTQTIMTHLSDDPVLVIALMKYGAKPPSLARHRDLSLAELAQNNQSIHASVTASALVVRSSAAVHFLEARGIKIPPVASTDTQEQPGAAGSTSISASTSTSSSSSSSSAGTQPQGPRPPAAVGTRNKEPLYTISGVVEELQHRIEELSTEDFATLRKAEGHQEEQISDDDAAASLSRQLDRVVKSFNTHPHPVRNGKKALFLVRNFVCLKYPDEDCAFLILRALYQAAHQYGVNQENCDPLPIISSILTGRVSDADIERRGADEDKPDPTLLRNFLANLQDGTQAHNIVEDGQRRLSLLDAEDQRLLSSLYDKIINLDAAEYATNRLRGLFAKQILEDAQEVIDQKYGNHQDGAGGTLADVAEMPPGLLQILHDVYAVADKLTALFLNGDLMRDAFAPFGADAAGGGPSAKRQKA